MNKKEKYYEYCNGCGLCHAVNKVDFEKKESGYSYPTLHNKDINLLEHVCPISKESFKKLDSSNIWGKTEEVYVGWSNDKKIRQQASSGGILTELCCFLIENKIVDGIIQTKKSSNKVYETETVVSTTPEEVRLCSGSRYSISSPLYSIFDLIKKDKKYAFVGKPCDVSALKNYLDYDSKYKDNFLYFFSFFCAGEPNNESQKKLLKELNIDDEKDCIDLRYRGEGWPGFTTAVKSDGNKYKMSYNDSWGKILGRNIRKSCRVCMDGIGEYADISCGDCWHLDSNMNPDFSEHDGQNVIFIRSQNGIDLMNEIKKTKKITVKKFDDYNEKLKHIQKYQLERKAYMHTCMCALTLFMKRKPEYDFKKLKKYSKHVKIMNRLKRFAGFCKRILKKKI